MSRDPQTDLEMAAEMLGELVEAWVQMTTVCRIWIQDHAKRMIVPFTTMSEFVTKLKLDLPVDVLLVISLFPTFSMCRHACWRTFPGTLRCTLGLGELEIDELDMKADDLPNAQAERLIGVQGCLSRLLSGTILAPSFVISPEWTQSLQLTAIGQECVDRAMANEKSAGLSLDDFMFACFIMEDLDLVESTFDPSQVMAAIRASMENKSLFFINNVGRDFHDECVAHFPDRSQSLENSEAIQVLSNLDQGVYQEGYILVGPLGVFQVDTTRNLRASADVPAFMCSDEQCFDVHRLRLMTDSSAGINRALRHLHGITRDSGIHPDRQKMRILLNSLRSAGRLSPALFDLLSDGLQDDELLSLVLHLYEQTEGSERLKIREMADAAKRSFSEAITEMTTASKIQLALFFADEQILSALDYLVMNQNLIFGQAEIRAPRVQGRWRSPIRSQFELSHLGTRHSRPTTTVALGLMQLVHTNYFSSGVASPSDLAFQLDAQGISDSEELLNAAIRLGDAPIVIEKVLLTDPRIASAVARQVGIVGFETMRKSELAGAILWKLGGELPFDFDGIQQVTENASSLELAVRSHAQQAEIRGIIANLFNVIEDSVRRSLIFTTWALTTDHERHADGFEFDPDLDSQVFSIIEMRTSTQDSYRLNPGGRNSFAPLAAGFSRLAEAVDSIISESQDQTGVRDDHTASEPLSRAILRSSRESSPVRPEVFVRGPAILSVSESSRHDVGTALRRMSALLGNAEVAKVRNSVIHPDNPFPSVEEVHQAVGVIREWAALVISSGFFPLVSRLIQKTQDDLGRSECIYESQAGKQRILLPTWHQTGRMPLDERSVIFIPLANLGAVGPLRFRLRQSGNEAYWRGYPHRITHPV